MWYQKFQSYWKENTLAQEDGDTGDSCQRIGTYWTLLSFIGITREQLKPHYELTIRAHEIVPGRYRRSPIENYWGSDPTNLSRDQQSILNLAFASQGDKKRLQESCIAIAKRGGFHQNFLRGTDDPTKYWKIPDFITPSQLCVYIRGMDLVLLYPILLVLDLTILLDLYLRKFNKWDADNMMAQTIFYSCQKYPTPWSRIAFHLYGITDFKKCLFNYHAIGNGIKPLLDLYLAAYDNLRGQYEKNPFDRFILCIIKWLCN